jgi:hypothetical protein
MDDICRRGGKNTSSNTCKKVVKAKELLQNKNEVLDALHITPVIEENHSIKMYIYYNINIYYIVNF